MLDNPPVMTTAATFCATLVDEWVRGGVTDAFAAPGSRSTPLALALANDHRLRLHVFHDERSASFAALGHSTANNNPAVLTCTSGTAAAHFHAAIIEADLSSIPLIVCTTDRPPELWQVGAPQTVRQTRLYGDAVRFYFEPGVPAESMAASWRSIGSQLVAKSRGWDGRAGPVHANLSFRDPLVGQPQPLPRARDGGRPWHDVGTDSGPVSGNPLHGSLAVAASISKRIRGLPGVVVAGNQTVDPASVLALARTLGWPVIADHQSGCRAEGQAIRHYESLLRSDLFRARHEPAVILQFGRPLASKTLGLWLASVDAELFVANPPGDWVDPYRTANQLVIDAGFARLLLAEIPPDYQPVPFAADWIAADEKAGTAIEQELARQEASHGLVPEPTVARAVVNQVPSGGTLLVASSMPVRDVEWFGPNRRDIRVVANRGANGIDGLIATAIGIAITGAPTTLLIGDVAFLHDCSSLAGLSSRALDLTIVVVNNDGGGIFSFLPQAELVGAETFEHLFGTPHGLNIQAIAEAFGISTESWESQISEQTRGVRVVVAQSDREINVDIHNALHNAVKRSIESV